MACSCRYLGDGEWGTCSDCSLKAELQSERRRVQELEAEVGALKSRLKLLEEVQYFIDLLMGKRT